MNARAARTLISASGVSLILRRYMILITCSMRLNLKHLLNRVSEVPKDLGNHVMFSDERVSRQLVRVQELIEQNSISFTAI